MKTIRVSVDGILRVLEFEGDGWDLEIEDGWVKVDNEEERKMWCWPKEKVLQVVVTE